MSTLRINPMHPGGRPATIDEQVVNECIFGECNHRHWTEFTDKYKRLTLNCLDCGCDFPFHEQDTPTLSKSDFLLSATRKYSEEPVLADLILRQVEAAAWRPMLAESQGVFFCTLESGSHKFSSGAHRSRPEAICAAAAKLAKSGAFKRSSAA